MAKSMSPVFPTAEQLTNASGFPLPPSYLSLLRLAFDRRGLRGMQNFPEEAIGLLLEGPWLPAINKRPMRSPRYPGTPPEFLTLGAMGVDGVQYGFIVRAPELSTTDYPVGEFSPIDGDPIALLGSTFVEAVENLASEAMSFREDDDSPLSSEGEAALADITMLFGIAPSAKKAERRYTRGGDAKPLPVDIPNGYKFQKTLDGIGVLAPRSAFASETIKVDACDAAATLATASDLLKADAPASALAVLRDNWWSNSGPAANQVASMMASAYGALQRPGLAQVAKQSMK